MQDRFEDMSTNIVSRIDEMGNAYTFNPRAPAHPRIPRQREIGVLLLVLLFLLFFFLYKLLSDRDLPHSKATTTIRKIKRHKWLHEYKERLPDIGF